MVAAIAFDMDGTIIDSESLWFSVHRKVFAEYGIDVTPEIHKKYWIRSSSGTRGILREHGIAQAYDEVQARKHLEWQKISDSLQYMPGALELIELLHPKFPLALVTYTGRKAIEGNPLFSPHIPKFAAIVSYNDVSNQKPHPEPYMKAAEFLRIDPSEFIAFEDSPKGVASAKGAGMRCIAVPNEWTNDGDFSSADLMVKSLADVNLDVIMRLSG